MAKGKKTGGRQKGTPNKDREDLYAICEQHGVNVFEGLVLLAARAEDDNTKFHRLMEIAPYLYAKRKQVDVGIDPEKSTIRVIIEDYGKK